MRERERARERERKGGRETVTEGREKKKQGKIDSRTSVPRNCNI